MLSIEDTLALSKPAPEFEELLKSDQLQAGGQNAQPDVHQMRKMMFEMGKSDSAKRAETSTSVFTEEDVQVTVRDGASITIRLHKPKEIPKGGCPVFVAFHGGGFIAGDLEVETPLCRLFTTLGGIAVNVDYRLAPEHPFPIPVNDCFDVVKWTVQNASSLGVNLEKGFIVGGESAGGSLALSTAYLWSEGKLSPPLTGIYSSIAVAAAAETVPEKYRSRFLSMEQNADAPLLTAEAMQLIFDSYKPDFKSPVAFPIMAQDLSGMPKTYFQACGMDPLRDSTLIIEQVWKDAGIPTKLDVYAGLPHGFWVMFPQLEACKKHWEDCKAGFQWLLS